MLASPSLCLEESSPTLLLHLGLPLYGGPGGLPATRDAAMKQFSQAEPLPRPIPNLLLLLIAPLHLQSLGPVFSFPDFKASSSLQPYFPFS